LICLNSGVCLDIMLSSRGEPFGLRASVNLGHSSSKTLSPPSGCAKQRSASFLPETGTSGQRRVAPARIVFHEDFREQSGCFAGHPLTLVLIRLRAETVEEILTSRASKGLRKAITVLGHELGQLIDILPGFCPPEEVSQRDDATGQSAAKFSLRSADSPDKPGSHCWELRRSFLCEDLDNGHGHGLCTVKA
jgi:hypothetical protein